MVSRMEHRFIAIIKDPGRIWTDYQVVDTQKFICMATCSREKDAETIATILNLHHHEREARQLVENTEVQP